MKKWILNILLVIISVVITLTILELTVRYVYRNVPQNVYEFRKKTIPKSYQNSPYFSAEFLKESFSQPGGWTVPPNTRLVIPNDFHGKYFNVTNGIRNTTDNPKIYKNTVYIFGGSTTYNSEVPDQFTIPSIIQRLINEKYPNKYRVLNYGASSVNTYQQLERLKTISLKKDDIVIFYNGVNDAYLLTTGRPNGWILGENNIEYEKLSLTRKMLFWVFNKYNSQLKFVFIFFYPYSKNIPEHLTNDVQITKLQEQLKHNYILNIRDANALCSRSHVLFYNFLQPIIFTRNPNTAYEKTLLNNFYIIPPAWRIAGEKSYPVLKICEDDFRSLKIRSYDLSSIFDQREDDFYLDFCHITDKGNKIIANEIFKRVFH